MFNKKRKSFEFFCMFFHKFQVEKTQSTITFFCLAQLQFFSTIERKLLTL